MTVVVAGRGLAMDAGGVVIIIAVGNVVVDVLAFNACGPGGRDNALARHARLQMQTGAAIHATVAVAVAGGVVNIVVGNAVAGRLCEDPVGLAGQRFVVLLLGFEAIRKLPQHR